MCLSNAIVAARCAKRLFWVRLKPSLGEDDEHYRCGPYSQGEADFGSWKRRTEVNFYTFSKIKISACVSASVSFHIHLVFMGFSFESVEKFLCLMRDNWVRVSSMMHFLDLHRQFLDHNSTKNASWLKNCSSLNAAWLRLVIQWANQRVNRSRTLWG